MLRKMTRRLMKRGQVGQSIVILALGMVALLGFVGITTDISLLFVRYSTLRRAVDSAAVAAAGQMRQDRSLAVVDITARQFIEVHGLNPRNVWVETCHNQPREDQDPATPGLQHEPPAVTNGAQALQTAEDNYAASPSEGTLSAYVTAAQDYATTLENFMSTEQVEASEELIAEKANYETDRDALLAASPGAPAAAITAWATSMEIYIEQLEREALSINDDPEICTAEQRKLVRVTAQIDSPTVFLRLFGWDDITLEASAVSETAVMDVVIVMDVSESMLTETTYNDWGQINLGMAYIPPRLYNSEGGYLTYASDTGTVIGNLTQDGWVPMNGSYLDWRVADTIAEYNTTAIYTDPPTSIPPAQVMPPAVADPPLSGNDEETWYEGWFWGAHLLGNWQQNVNDRLYWLERGEPIDGAGIAEPGNPTPANALPEDPNNQYYQVRSFVPRAVAVDSPAGAAQGHPREACRVRFYPYSTRYSMTQTWPAYRDGEVETIAQLYATDPNVQGGTPLTNADWPNIENWGAPGLPQPQFNGFVPMYNFYGCCNDPTVNVYVNNAGEYVDGIGDPLGNRIPTSADAGDPTLMQGDWDFSDLVCQPFKQARDATREFLDRIDFLRGDRVAFVTFDRSAFLIDPDGVNGSATHMLETLDDARSVLNRFVGVRAEPNYYVWGPDGGWTGYSAGIEQGTGESIPLDYGYTGDFDNDGVIDEVNVTTNTTDPAAFNYPAFGNCGIQNTLLSHPQSLYATRNVPLGSSPYTGGPAIENFMTPPIYTDPDWVTQRTARGLTFENSYEMWAACRGTNMGAALREAGNAFTNAVTSRREGTVWVMIMLSDGAAGASDPVRIEGAKAVQADPYFEVEQYDWRQRNQPEPFDGNQGIYGSATRADYGTYGLCPFGRLAAPTRLGELITGESDSFPWCSDVDPFTRHFCLANDSRPVGMANLSDPVSNDISNSYGTGFRPGAADENYTNFIAVDQAEYDAAAAAAAPNLPSILPPIPASFYPTRSDRSTLWIQNQNILRGNIFEVDIGDINDPTNKCDPLYDVEDYARDWADYIADVDDESNTGSNVLPTVFTIGFGLNFPNGAGDCDDNPEDCAGEELLRYIADAGDNYRIDHDIYQDIRHDTTDWTDYAEDTDYPTLDGSVQDWGPRDPCQAEGLEWPHDVDGDGQLDDVNGDGVVDAVDTQSLLDSGTLILETRTAGESCGNYYNAPSQAELRQVFDDIASRMFTRIAG